MNFKQLSAPDDMQQLIKSIFDVELAIEGGWGYTPQSATVIKALPDNMPLNQLQHMIASMRSHLEMNLTQEKENRYSGINLNEKQREEVSDDEIIFNKVSYEISAIKEDLYNTFIREYKEGYGKSHFDLNAHFKKRAESTLVRKVVYYFDTSRLN